MRASRARSRTWRYGSRSPAGAISSACRTSGGTRPIASRAADPRARLPWGRPPSGTRCGPTGRGATRRFASSSGRSATIPGTAARSSSSGCCASIAARGRARNSTSSTSARRPRRKAPPRRRRSTAPSSSSRTIRAFRASGRRPRTPTASSSTTTPGSRSACSRSRPRSRRTPSSTASMRSRWWRPSFPPPTRTTRTGSSRWSISSSGAPAASPRFPRSATTSAWRRTTSRGRRYRYQSDLDDRVAHAADRVAAYQDADPANDPPLIGGGGGSCVYCHNK